MGKRRFKLHFSMYDEHIDSAVIEVVDNAWRSMFHNLRTAERIAAHIGYNLIISGISLSQMDGWADQPYENARVLEWPTLADWDIEAEEIENES